MANIRDVAQEAGVSITTVSRILSRDDTFKVTAQTRQRVLDAATRLDYRFRPSARKQKVKLGCVLALTAEKYGDPFFDGILAAAEEECDRQNAVISVLKNYNDLQKRETMEELTNAGLSGLILMERVSTDVYKQLEAHIPNILFVDNDESNCYFNGVGFDHAAANWQAMNCLISHGYRRIGIISGGSPNEPFLNSTRFMIYQEALQRARLPFDEKLVKDCAWDLDLCASQARELLSLPEPPDAIFAGSDSLASAILGALYGMGLRCPRDIGVIGFNNINLSAHLIPPLTTIEIPTYEIGVTAVQRLMDMVRGNGGMSRKILFPTKLIMRDSLKEEAYESVCRD